MCIKCKATAKTFWIDKILADTSIMHKIFNNILVNKNILVQIVVKTKVCSFEKTFYFFRMLNYIFMVN